MSAARFLVSGRVQGVWFRAATREQALAQGLCGFARNLDDGGVEVVAVGEAAGIDALERWLWQGPPLAKVARVERQAFEAAGTLAGFDTR